MHHVMILLLICGANGQNNFFNVPSCTDIKLRDTPEEVFEKCQKPGLVIHCLPDDYGNQGFCCFPVTLIRPGRCPYYNSYQGNMDDKKCSSLSGLCPSEHFQSCLSIKYKGCYPEEYVTTTKAATTTETDKTQYIPSANRSDCTSSEVSKGFEDATVALIVFSVIVVVVGVSYTCKIWKEKKEKKIKRMARNGSEEHTPTAGSGSDDEESQKINA